MVDYENTKKRHQHALVGVQVALLLRAAVALYPGKAAQMFRKGFISQVFIGLYYV